MKVPTGFWLASDWLLTGVSLGSDWLLTAYWLGSAWLLTGFSLVADWLLTGLWLVTDWLLFGFWLVTDWLLTGYSLGSDWLLTDVWLVTHWLLTGYWLGSDGYWLDSDWLLTGFSLGFDWWLTGYWLHSDWLLTGYWLGSDWLLAGFSPSLGFYWKEPSERLDWEFTSCLILSWDNWPVSQTAVQSDVHVGSRNSLSCFLQVVKYRVFSWIGTFLPPTDELDSLERAGSDPTNSEPESLWLTPLLVSLSKFLRDCLSSWKSADCHI